jgi:hypothetical protein
MTHPIFSLDYAIKLVTPDAERNGGGREFSQGQTPVAGRDF